MSREKSIVRRMDMIAVSFSSSASINYKSFSANQEQTHETQAAMLDPGSSNAMPPH